MNRNQFEKWDLEITPHRGWFDLRLADLWRYRDLVWLFVQRDFVAYYKQTILGPIWYLIQPILSTLIMTVIFGNIAKLSTDGTPAFLFYLAGNTLWGYFSSCLTNTSNTFVSNAGLFGKVYFPRLSVPVSIMISQLISFAIRFAVFLIFIFQTLYSGAEIHPNRMILLLPLLVFLMGGLGLGFGIIVSSLTTKYRDLQQFVGFGAQLLMYATPIIFPLSSVQGAWRTVLLLNPLTAIVETFRLGFLGVSAIDPVWLWYSCGVTILVLFIGLLLFNHVETTFMDTV